LIAITEDGGAVRVDSSPSPVELCRIEECSGIDALRENVESVKGSLSRGLDQEVRESIAVRIVR
jgi:hypothetical protein